MLNTATVLSAVIAVAIPLIMILIRSNVRIKREGVLTEIGAALDLEGRSPSFEFVKSKYSENGNKLHPLRLLMSSIPFIALAAIGLDVIFVSLANEAPVPEPLKWLANNVLLTDGTNVTAQLREALTLLAFGFAGAILFSLSYLTRALTNYELGPLSFLRVTVHMLLALVIIVALWRGAIDVSLAGAGEAAVGAAESGAAAGGGAAGGGAAGDAGGGSGGGAAGGGANGGATGFNNLWFILAFLIGFFPDLGLRYMLTRVTLPLKSYRTNLYSHVRGVPLEVIDGIDAWTSFRLEESMLFDVQNLGTANPIMLHVETPYGFYECIDWVAQAQLCMIVGADAFIELRHRNIRTIFDLERATVGAGSSPAMRAAIGTIVFGPKLPPGTTPAATANSGWPQPAFTDPDLTQMFEGMLDDLHIRRLRQIWELVGCALGPRYSRLSPLHSDNCPPRPCDKPAAQKELPPPAKKEEAPPAPEPERHAA